MARVHPVAVGVLAVAALACARDARAKGGPVAPIPVPAPVPAPAPVVVTDVQVKAGLDAMLASSSWDLERVVAPTAVARQKTWLVANFAVRVANVTGDAGVELAVSDPGKGGVKGHPDTRVAGGTIRQASVGAASSVALGVLTLRTGWTWHETPLAAGAYGVAIRGWDSRSKQLTLEVAAVEGAGSIAEIDVPRDAVVKLLDGAGGEAAEQSLGQAVLLNFVAARLSLGHRLATALAAVLAGPKPEPAMTANLNSSKSNAFRAAGLIDQPVALATTVKSGKSNSSERTTEAPPVVMATARYAKLEGELARVARGEVAEMVVGRITLVRDLVLPVGGGVSLKSGTYGVALLDAKHHTQAGRTETIIELVGPDGATVGGVFVDGGVLSRQLLTAPASGPFASAFGPALVLNVVVAVLEERR